MCPLDFSNHAETENAKPIGNSQVVHLPCSVVVGIHITRVDLEFMEIKTEQKRTLKFVSKIGDKVVFTECEHRFHRSKNEQRSPHLGDS